MKTLHHIPQRAPMTGSRFVWKPAALLIFSLFFMLFSTTAFARWTPPETRPFLSGTLQTHRVSDGGLETFSNLSGGESISLLGVELGFPVAGEWTLHTRFQSGGTTSPPPYGGNFTHLKVNELTVGLSYGHALKCWLIPRIQMDAGATSSQVTLGSSSREYSDSGIRPTVGAKIGIEFRGPGFTWSEKASHRWFRQFSVSLLVSYGAQWRQSVHFGSVSPDDEIPGTVVGADLGSLGLSGHGVDVRFDLRF